MHSKHAKQIERKQTPNIFLSMFAHAVKLFCRQQQWFQFHFMPYQNVEEKKCRDSECVITYVGLDENVWRVIFNSIQCDIIYRNMCVPPFV